MWQIEKYIIKKGGSLLTFGSPIARGNTADIYICNDIIVKLFHEKTAPNEALREARKHAFVYSCGINVPKVWVVRKIDNRQAIIMEYIQGKTLGQMYQEEICSLDDILTLSVAVQQQLHYKKTVHSSAMERMKQKLERQIATVNQLERSEKVHLMQLLDMLPEDASLCHGDYHFFNLIASNNRVTIIDWVDASIGNIGADVYRTYLLYSQFSLEIAEKYLFYYCKTSDLKRKEIFQWAPIIAAARLSEGVTTENEQRLMEIIHDGKKG